MRITGGRMCGRILAVPKTGDIRPSQDRVREALFSMLMGRIEGARFLDLFAGTGAVGIEALSRGAAETVFVEKSREHIRVLQRNLAMGDNAGIGHGQIIEGDAYNYISVGNSRQFDIVFADPPYAIGKDNGYLKVLSDLRQNGIIKPGGVFIAEMIATQQPEETEGWQLWKDRRYGSTRLALWLCNELAVTPDA